MEITRDSCEYVKSIKYNTKHTKTTTKGDMSGPMIQAKTDVQDLTPFNTNIIKGFRNILSQQQTCTLDFSVTTHSLIQQLSTTMLDTHQPYTNHSKQNAS